jgi:hypothetical protein
MPQTTKAPTARKPSSFGRLGGDGQHQSGLAFAGGDAARAERHGEQSQHDDDRHRKRFSVSGRRRAGRGEAEAQRQGRGDGADLQGEIGRDAQHGNRGGDGGHRFRLAIARREEIGDRCGVLRMGEPRHPGHQRPAKAEHQHRPDVNGEEIQAVA